MSREAFCSQGFVDQSVSLWPAKRDQKPPLRPPTSDLSPDVYAVPQARVAMAEVLELLEAGEAKALYGLSINWKPLQALVEALQDRGVLQGKEVRGAGPGGVMPVKACVRRFAMGCDCLTKAFFRGYGFITVGGP